MAKSDTEVMNSGTIRQKFLDFFESKGHQIVPSAPLVLKNDPALVFTNSGMVQFKDFFLGNAIPKSKRVADTQKCLRVSGKHNDLEDVGHDTYHHTMFEMLGNWSFGDYFKKEAIAWAWELLTEVYKLPKDRLYVSVFGGDKDDKLAIDQEAFDLWKSFVAEDRIILGNKKDNFWEMADVGPCGPCSEIHIDLRPEAEVKKKAGKELVNADHPQVVEIWNLVFMEFVRYWDPLKGGASELLQFDLGPNNTDKVAREKLRIELTLLKPLPAKNVDTGMGFERLCMAIQGKTSNYDTDVFSPMINFIAKEAGVAYGHDAKKDIAIRVLADHIRAVSFAIADGQLPSNTGAGYVIRRILRRAVRYGFSYLNFKEPFIYKLVPILASQLKNAFPELHRQMDYVGRVVNEEENSFLRTLDDGIFSFNQNFVRIARMSLRQYFNNKNIIFEEVSGEETFPDFYLKDYNIIICLSFNSKTDIYRSVKTINGKQEPIPFIKVIPYHLLAEKFWDEVDIKKIFSSRVTFGNVIDGHTAFILYDTHGFPIDLTQLMAKEIGFTVDMDTFALHLNEQKSRSKSAAAKETGDWIIVHEIDKVEFIGYEFLEATSKLARYRKIKQKNKELFQLVLDKTPFYAESGGQVGDTGIIESSGEKIAVIDTKKENDLIVHYTEKMPIQLDGDFKVSVNPSKRRLSMCNHSATHLLHAALRQVLGKHVEQKGSLVNEKILRFDFSHFAAMTDEELKKVETIVNQKIRENIQLNEQRNVPIAKAKSLGAMALFGEKYGDFVRVITFDPKFSVELCGGTHVPATGQIGLFKILAESSVAAGVRRIEAVTAEGAEQFINEEIGLLNEVKSVLKNSKDVISAAKNLMEEKHQLEKKLEALYQQQANLLKDELVKKGIKSKDYTLVMEKISVPNADVLKNIAYGLRNQFNDLLMILAADVDGKPQVAVMVGEVLEKTNKFHAGNMVKELAKEIDGGGGGQPFFATAGGKNLAGLDKVLEKAKVLIN